MTSGKQSFLWTSFSETVLVKWAQRSLWKDHNQNFREKLQLLGCDLKIFTKILANRLNKHISTIIHPDQVGFIYLFILFRFSFSVRRLLNIVYSKQKNNSKSAVLALDAHKAFNQVKWRYMQITIEEFSLSKTFRSWVEMLYACPVASVLTNSERSPPFSLHCGVQQGCPLSPLLFAICIEPLAISIRDNPNVTPIHFGKIDHFIGLYANDIILFFSQCEQSVPRLLNLIKTSGKLY